MQNITDCLHAREGNNSKRSFYLPYFAQLLAYNRFWAVPLGLQRKGGYAIVRNVLRTALGLQCQQIWVRFWNYFSGEGDGSHRMQRRWGAKGKVRGWRGGDNTGGGKGNGGGIDTRVSTSPPHFFFLAFIQLSDDEFRSIAQRIKRGKPLLTKQRGFRWRRRRW